MKLWLHLLWLYLLWLYLLRSYLLWLYLLWLYLLWLYLLWLYLLWQVRKMTHAVGHPTLRLVRVRVAQQGQATSALAVPEPGSCPSAGHRMAALAGSTLPEKGRPGRDTCDMCM